MLFLAPNYGMNDRWRINTSAWLDVLRNTKATAIVCHADTDVIISRLMDRFLNKWLKDKPSKEEIVSMMHLYLLKDVLFSYKKLYEDLKKDEIEFIIYNT